MVFPSRETWWDSIWPCAEEPKEGSRIVVAAHEGGKMELAAKEAVENPGKIFMFLVEDFDYFIRTIPDLWRRPHAQDGGFPQNVWVGASFYTQEELDERAARLLNIRAKRLFLLAQKDHEPIDIHKHLIPWRCMNCGRRGYDEWPLFCPTGAICRDEDKIMPQISWVIDEDRDPDSELAQVCEGFRAALWDGVQRQVPE